MLTTKSAQEAFRLEVGQLPQASETILPPLLTTYQTTHTPMVLTDYAVTRASSSATTH